MISCNALAMGCHVCLFVEVSIYHPHDKMEKAGRQPTRRQANFNFDLIELDCWYHDLRSGWKVNW